MELPRTFPGSPTQLSLARPVIMTKLRSAFCRYVFTFSITGGGERPAGYELKTVCDGWDGVQEGSKVWPPATSHLADRTDAT